MAKVLAIQWDLSFDQVDARLSIMYAVFPEGEETFSKFVASNDILVNSTMTDSDINSAIEQGSYAVLPPGQGIVVSQIMYSAVANKIL